MDTKKFHDKGYVELGKGGRGVEAASGPLQMMHGRLTTMITGLRRQHPMLHDCFGTTTSMIAVVLDMKKLREEVGGDSSVGGGESSGGVEVSVQNKRVLKIGKPKGVTAGAFVLCSSGGVRAGGTKHVQQRNYIESVDEKTGVLFYSDLSGRTHVTVDVGSKASAKASSKASSNVSEEESSCWIGVFLFSFPHDVQDKAMALVRNVSLFYLILFILLINILHLFLFSISSSFR